MRRQHHAQCRAAIPFQFELLEPALDPGLGGGEQQFDQIAFHAHQDRLGFRVTQTAIEFERFDLALRVDHQACIQEAGVFDTVFFHTTQGGQNHLAHGTRMDRWCHHRCW